MKRLKANIISINVGKPKQLYGLDQEVTTAIEKHSIDDEIALTRLNLAGDEQADKKNHGGEDKAVCVYPYDHYPFWEKEYDISLPLGAFGENITIKGLVEESVNIGDMFQWGDAVVQVSQPRMPCHKVAKRYNLSEMPPLMTDTGYTGFYLRVLKEGTVSSKTPFLLIKRYSDVSIAEINQLTYHDKCNISAIEKVCAVEELADGWRNMLQKRLKKEVAE